MIQNEKEYQIILVALEEFNEALSIAESDPLKRVTEKLKWQVAEYLSRKVVSNNSGNFFDFTKAN